MELSTEGVASAQHATRRALLIEAQRAAAGEAPGIAEAVLVPHIVGKRGVPPGDLRVDEDAARRADEPHFTDESAVGVVDARMIDVGCGWPEAAEWNASFWAGRQGCVMLRG